MLDLFVVSYAILSLSINLCCGENFTEDTLQEAYGEVIFCSALFRHGDRTVNKVYPTDPYQANFWTEGVGQLTKIGKLHAYKLGQWFRKRYDKLLQGRPYTRDLLLVNSSNIDRTLMSGELFMAGFYPPSEKERWNNEGILQWQPIPVHTVAKEQDNLILMEKPCERYDLEMAQLGKSPELEAYFENHMNLFKYVAEYSGFNMSKENIVDAIIQFGSVYDSLFIEDSNKLELPPWTKQVYPQPMRIVALLALSLSAYTTTMQRLTAGPMLKAIIHDMTVKRDKWDWKRIFHFYSGHDTSIVAVLMALGVFNGARPPYSSSVIVELRQKNAQYYVTVLYRNSTEAPPHLLEIRGCKNPCTLDDFISATKSVVSEDWNDECDPGVFLRPHYASLPLIIIVVLIVLLLIAVLIFLRRRFIQRNRHRYTQFGNVLYT